jgi:hypothetical protein
MAAKVQKKLCRKAGKPDKYLEYGNDNMRRVERKTKEGQSSLMRDVCARLARSTDSGALPHLPAVCDGTGARSRAAGLDTRNIRACKQHGRAVVRIKPEPSQRRNPSFGYPIHSGPDEVRRLCAAQ